MCLRTGMYIYRDLTRTASRQYGMLPRLHPTLSHILMPARRHSCPKKSLHNFTIFPFTHSTAAATSFFENVCSQNHRAGTQSMSSNLFAHTLVTYVPYGPPPVELGTYGLRWTQSRKADLHLRGRALGEKECARAICTSAKSALNSTRKHWILSTHHKKNPPLDNISQKVHGTRKTQK